VLARDLLLSTTIAHYFFGAKPMACFRFVIDRSPAVRVKVGTLRFQSTQRKLPWIRPPWDFFVATFPSNPVRKPPDDFQWVTIAFRNALGNGVPRLGRNALFLVQVY